MILVQQAPQRCSSHGTLTLKAKSYRQRIMATSSPGIQVVRYFGTYLAQHPSGAVVHLCIVAPLAAVAVYGGQIVQNRDIPSCG